jgi:aryl-alcohol dehydrogenase-like predicted oxidoreductase
MAMANRIVLGSADLRDDGVTAPLLDRFYELGGRSLDVANVYADGESASAVGAWLTARAVRDEMFVYAKGCHPPFCSPSLVASEVDKARGDLGAERLDRFMLHRDDLSFPVDAFGDALLEQAEAGKIGGFGVSNWTMQRFIELSDYLADAPHQPRVFSNHFSLGEMVTPTWPGCLAMTKDDLRELGDRGVEVLAWASLAAGYLAGRNVSSWDDPGNDARRTRAHELAAGRGASPTAVALAYVLSQSPGVRAVFGTRAVAHIDEAMVAGNLELSTQEVEWLETGVE